VRKIVKTYSTYIDILSIFLYLQRGKKEKSMTGSRDVVVIATLTKDVDPGKEYRVGTVPAGTRIIRRGDIRAFDEVRQKAVAVFNCLGIHHSFQEAMVHAHKESAEVKVVHVADLFPEVETA
jgi:hypothetical protein